MTRPDPISRLAARAALYGLPASRRERLAEATLALALAAARRLATSGTPHLRGCDIRPAAVDASAWCMGDGLHRYDPARASWRAFVGKAVRREAGRIRNDEARQEDIRRKMAQEAGDDGDVSHF